MDRGDTTEAAMENSAGRRIIGVLMSVGSFYLLRNSNGEPLVARLSELFVLLAGLLMAVGARSTA